MNFIIYPKKLDGSVSAPPSKSYIHRVLICEALCLFTKKGDSFVVEKKRREEWESLAERAAAESRDGEETAEALKRLICALDEEKEETLRFEVKESGATLRFLMPLAAALRETSEFRCGPALAGRPMAPLISALSERGCRVEKRGDSYFLSGKLKGGVLSLPGDVSSQFVSGLLFTLPFLSEESKIEVTGPVLSFPYIDMTLEVLKEYGIIIEKLEEPEKISFFLKGKCKYERKGALRAWEGDWSGGAIFLAAGAAGEGRGFSFEQTEDSCSAGGVTVKGLRKDSLQGDKAIGKILKGNRFLEPFEADGAQIPDLVPALCVLGAAAKGQSRILGCGRLRFKESDRLETLVQSFSALGCDIHWEEELRKPQGRRDCTLVINGHGSLRGGKASGAGDHRIVMALAAASVICQNPVIIEGAEAVAKSYPRFFKDFKSLGGEISEI